MRFTRRKMLSQASMAFVCATASARSTRGRRQPKRRVVAGEVSALPPSWARMTSRHSPILPQDSISDATISHMEH